MSDKLLRFHGASAFRYRLLLATMSSRAIRIDDIRAMDESPGITEFEASFLQLLEKITNGSRIEINETGTMIRYFPGVISGGAGLEHDCSIQRSIGYYLEPLICLALFSKKPVEIKLTGVLNDDLDISVDLMRVVTLPMLKTFGVEEDIELKIVRRGAPPLGGGEIFFRCGMVKQLNPVRLLDAGKIKRIRGIAYTARVNPTIGTRVVTSARNILNSFIPDVWIYTDHYKGKDAGLSPGFALSLLAESTTGCLLSAEKIGEKDLSPEDLGNLVSKILCDEIAQNGCIDSYHQSLAVVLMSLCPEDVSSVRIGKLTQQAIEVLRLLKTFFGVMFHIRPDEKDRSIILSCKGVGYRNWARKALA